MNTEDKKAKKREALKAAAEKKLETAMLNLDDASTAQKHDIKSLLHDLQVHAIELELQNEELLNIQEKLELTKNQLSDLFDFAPVGYLVLDEDAIILNSNNTLCSLLSEDKEKIIGQNFFHLLRNDYKDKFYKILRGQFASNKTSDSEVVLNDTLNNQITVMIKTKLMTESHKNVKHCLMTISDVTEFKRIEEEKTLRDKKLKIISEIMSDYTYEFIVGQNNSLELKWVSGAFQDITGFTPEESEVRGGWTNLIFPADLAITSKRIKKLLNGEEDESEFRIVCKDGSIKWIRDFGKPILINNKVVGIIGCAKDISVEKESSLELENNYTATLNLVEDLSIEIKEHKRTEEALSQSEEKYRSIFENSSMGKFRSTPDGRLIIANDAFAKIFGFINSIEILNARVNLKGFYKSKSVRENLERILEREGFVDNFEAELIKKDGSEAWILLKIRAELYGDGNIYYEGTAQDITESKRIQYELKISEERFQLAMYATRDGLYDWNLVTNEIYYSPSWKLILGYEYDELPNDFSVWQNLTDPKDLEESWIMQQELIARKRERFVKEFRMKHKDGHWVDILSQARAIFDKNGKAVRIVGTHTDISENKKAKRLLEEQKQFLSTLIDAIPIPVFYKDKMGKYIGVNSSFEKFLGASRNELIGKTVFETASKEFALIYDKKDKELLKSGLQQIYESSVVDTKGEKKDVVFYKSVYSDYMNDVSGIIGCILDITEIKKVNQQVINSKEQLSKVINNISNVFYEHDINHKLKYISPQINDILGYNPEEALIKWTDLTSDNELNNVGYQLTMEAIKTGKTQKPYNLELVHKNGKKIWVEVKEAPLIENGKVVSIVGSLNDVTERKLAEEKLKESQSLLQKAEEISDQGSWKWDIQNDIWSFSDAWINMTGFSHSGISSKELIKIAHPDDRAKINIAFEDALNKRKNYDLEHRIIRQDNGAIRNIKAIGEVHFTENGKPDFMIGIARDITESKEAEEKLKESEEKYRSIFENSALGIFRSTPEGRYEEVNPAFAEILGYDSPQKIIDEVTNISKLYKHPEDREKIKDEFARNGFVKDYEIVAQNLGDETVWISVNAKEQTGKDGHLYYEGTVQNITEKKLAQERLKESEEKYRALYENAPQSYQSLNDDGNIIDVNPMWINTLGYKKEKILGTWFGDLLHPDYLKQFEKYFPEFKRRGSVHNVEFKLRKMDGSYITVLYEGCAGYTPEGKFKQTYSVFKDISEQRIAEQKLIESENKYRLLFETAPLGIAYFDTDGKVISFNYHAAKSMGGSPDNFKGKTLFSLYGRKYGRIYKNRITAAIEAPETLLFEDFVELPIGSWFVTSYNKVVDSNGKVTGVQIISTDITEIKRAEEETKVNLIKYKTLFESLPMGITVSDESGNIIESNTISEKLLGLKSYEHLQRTINAPEWKIIKPNGELIPSIEFPSVRALKEKKIISNVVMGIEKGKQNITWINVTATPIDLKGYGVLISYFDITERIFAEEQIKASESKYRILLENLQEGIWQIDKNTSTVFVNDKIYNILGYTVKEMMGKKLYDFMDEENGNKAKQYFKNRKEGLSELYEFTFTHKKGYKVNTLMSAAPLFNSKNKFNGALASLIDISERKRFEEELIKSNAMLQAAFDNSDAGIVIANVPDGKLIYVNSAGLLIRGKKGPRHLKDVDISSYVSAWKILHLDGTPYIRKEVPLARAVLYGETVHEEFIVRRDNNEDRYVLANAAPINDDKGKRIAAIVVFQDITDMKLAEMQILKERNRAQQYLDSASVLMLSLDAKGKIMMINDKGAEILGYKKKYIIGKNWFDYFIPEKEKVDMKKVFRSAIKGSTELNEYYENPVKCRYNKIRMLAWHNNFIRNSEGEIIGSLSSAEDITERLALGRELEKSYQELKKLSEHQQLLLESERKSLAREIHDDLGQMLTAIKIDISRAQKKVNTTDIAVLSNLESAKELAIETLSKVQKITSDLRPGMIDDLGLIPTIRWYVDEFKKRNELKGYLSINICEEDVSKNTKIVFYRILQEALTNVSRHSKAKWVRIKIEKKPKHIQLSIKDNGVGISKKYKNEIGSFGIMGMKERASNIGAAFSIISKTNTGTEIKVNFPI